MDGKTDGRHCLGMVEAMLALVELGAEMEAKLDDGWTPLRVSAHTGQLEAIHISGAGGCGAWSGLLISSRWW